MARIDYCDTSKSSERTREILGKNRNANIFRMMAHSPSYFEQYCRLGGAIRNKGELDPVVRELAITRTGILCEARWQGDAPQWLAIGIGINVANDIPVELRRSTAAGVWSKSAAVGRCWPAASNAVTNLLHRTIWRKSKKTKSPATPAAAR